MKPTPESLFAIASRAQPTRRRAWAGAVAVAATLLAGSPLLACPGDCDGDGAVLVDELIRSVNIALGTTDLATCVALDRDFDGSVTVDEIVAAVGNALEGCPAPERTAFVVATDFETGSFATVDLATRRLLLPAAPSRRVNADAVARAFDDRVYVVNRFGLRGDSIQVLDPAANFAVLSDCSTGARNNPQDIAFVNASKAYVTLYETSQLLIIDPSAGANCAGFVRGNIDLSAFADADGIPEMERLLLVGETLYVSLQRLDRDDMFRPAANGVVVAIDTTTDRVSGSMELSSGNPFGPLVVRGDRLYVSAAGRFGQNDGGIEEIDLRGGTARGWLISEEAIGGDVTDFVLVSDRVGFAVVSDAAFRNQVVEFSPRAGTRTRTLFSESSYIAQLRLTDAGDLFVADRTFARPGLRIFDVRSGSERPESPIDLGLPPFDILFLRAPR